RGDVVRRGRGADTERDAVRGLAAIWRNTRSGARVCAEWTGSMQAAATEGSPRMASRLRAWFDDPALLRIQRDDLDFYLPPSERRDDVIALLGHIDSA